MNLLKIIILGLALSVSGCVKSTSVRYDNHPNYSYYKSGPPPHAPAHGYRHHYHHHDMIYDSGIRSYIVVGWHDHYYSDGFYFRFRDGRWQISINLSDGWRDAREREMPYSLYRSKHKQYKYKDSDRNRYTAPKYKSHSDNDRDGVRYKDNGTRYEPRSEHDRDGDRYKDNGTRYEPRSEHDHDGVRYKGSDSKRSFGSDRDKYTNDQHRRTDKQKATGLKGYKDNENQKLDNQRWGNSHDN